MTPIQEFTTEMKKLDFSSVSVSKYVYVLTEKSLYRLHLSGESFQWKKINIIEERHGSLPPAVVVSGAIYVVGSGGGGEVRMSGSKAVSKYDPLLNQWKRLANKELATIGSAVVAAKGCIYSVGGYAIGVGATDRVERLDVAPQTWIEIAPMREKRVAASAIECRGKIIVAGGLHSRLRSVEIFSPDVNQWTSLTPMKKGRWFF